MSASTDPMSLCFLGIARGSRTTDDRLPASTWCRRDSGPTLASVSPVSCRHQMAALFCGVAAPPADIVGHMLIFWTKSKLIKVTPIYRISLRNKCSCIAITMQTHMVHHCKYLRFLHRINVTTLCSPSYPPSNEPNYIFLIILLLKLAFYLFHLLYFSWCTLTAVCITWRITNIAK